MRVKQELDNYVVCRTWNGAQEGSVDVAVAKPVELRGWTATRTLNGIDETIKPAYGVNELVYAVRVYNGTGVSDDASNTIYWLDTNNAGRRWAEACTE